MTMTMEKRVLNGAKFLDKKFPNWAKEVVIKYLDMSDASHCMLGQLEDIHEEIRNSYLTIEYPSVKGFNLSEGEYNDDKLKLFRKLRNLWIDQIRLRRKK